MHIVALTGHYYPFMKPPERCISPFLENLSEDHIVEIVCPVYDRRYQDPFIKGNIKLYFVDSFANKVKSFIQTNRELERHKFLNGVLYWFYRASRYVYSWVKKEAYEDSSLAKSLLVCAEKINVENKIDIIISVSLPFYSHVAALYYKRCHPDVRWITFTTDPFAYNEVNTIVAYKKREAIALEQKVYDTCDHCITTEELYSNLRDDYRIKASKILRLPYLLTEKASEDKTKGKIERDGYVNVLYAGYLYYKIRNPKLMMETFRYIPSVKFNLYVAGDRFCRKYLKGQFPENYKINGLVPRTKYLEHLAANDVLVNLSNTILLQAPSKLLELISTGKPVINFYYHKDTGYRIIEKYPLGINISCSMNPREIAKELTAFIEQNAYKRLPYNYVCELFEEHIFENQVPLFRQVVIGY